MNTYNNKRRMNIYTKRKCLSRIDLIKEVYNVPEPMEEYYDCYHSIPYFTETKYERLDMYEGAEEKVLNLCHKYNVEPYMVIRKTLHHKNLITILYVEINDDDKEDELFEEDRLDLIEGTPYAYVYNMDDPEFSEFGKVEISKMGSTIMRLS